MSFERDQGDDLFSKYKFKQALHYYLKAHSIFYTKGNEEEERQIKLKIARCFALIGRKNEAIKILEDLYFQTRDQLLFQENIEAVIELAATYILYGEYTLGIEWLNSIEEEDITLENNVQMYFRYWQLRAQILIIYHHLEESRKLISMLKEKAQEYGNEVYYYELNVLEAQIDAEKGDVMTAFSKLEQALKYFEETPFERSAFEKKIILSQFTEEPETTVEYIDSYIQKYGPEDIQPLALNAYRIELELRAEKITPEEAIEKGERLLSTVESIENKDIASKLYRLLAGLNQTIGQFQKAIEYYLKAKKYFVSENLVYEEALTTFIFLPALIQNSSRLMLRDFSGIFINLEVSKELENVNIEEEMERIMSIFEEYDDIVKAKMTKFFFLSYQITQLNLKANVESLLEGIEDIYQWMVDQGEIAYSEMIGNFLELFHHFKF